MASSVNPHIGGVASDLLLKVTPPRVPRDLVVRPRLNAETPIPGPRGDHRAGTCRIRQDSLLAQWRREHLAQGRVVAWLSAQAEDNPQRWYEPRVGRAHRRRAAQLSVTRCCGTAPGGFEGITPGSPK